MRAVALCYDSEFAPSAHLPLDKSPNIITTFTAEIDRITLVLVLSAPILWHISSPVSFFLIAWICGMYWSCQKPSLSWYLLRQRILLKEGYCVTQAVAGVCGLFGVVLVARPLFGCHP
ncbi:hypothetical protein BDR03DRAFT_351237 [Suillus americanus]|nr:hypothetical protein BDR03DRAFT_351237 [Suillus americanus]